MIGKESEEEFLKRMLSKNRVVVRSSREQDMFEHIDFFVDGVSYDVKGQKSLDRNKVGRDDIIWLELKNVRGDKGWLESKVQKIAFQIKDKFYVVDREKLSIFTHKFVYMDRGVYNYKRYRYLYNRKTKQDLLSYVFFNDIKHLVEETI